MAAQLVHRALHPDDRRREDGSTFVLSADLAATEDARVPTDDFASTDLVLLVVESARPDGADVVIPAGTRLRVDGRRAYTHHLASAVDVEVSTLLVAEEGVAGTDAEFTRGMLMLGLAMASGPSGRGDEASRFAGPMV